MRKPIADLDLAGICLLLALILLGYIVTRDNIRINELETQVKSLKIK